MPPKVRKVNGYQVKSPTGRVHAKGTTLRKAKRQARLLRAIEHGFKPTKKRRGGR